MKRTIHIQIIDIEKMQQTGIKVTGSGVIDRVGRAVNCEIHRNGTSLERLKKAIENLPTEIYFSPAVKMDLDKVVCESFNPDETITVRNTETERLVQIVLSCEGKIACMTVYDLPKDREPAVLGGCWFDASEVFFPMKSYDFMEV